MKGICTKCGAEEELAKKSATKYRSYCKLCDSKKSSNRHNSRKKAARIQQIKEIGADACMICGQQQMLKVDHCHKSGAVRGLLCNSCNTGIGFFKDRPELLEKAIIYLKTENNFGLYYKIAMIA